MVKVWPVIATRNRPDWLRRQMERLLPQLQKGERVVVVIDGSPDAAYDRDGMSAAGVLLLEWPERKGIYFSRRAGNAFVPTDAVVCAIDDHDLVEPVLLERLRAAFADEKTMLAYCDVWHTDPAGKVRRLREKADGSFAEHGQLGLGMRAYRKWVYDCVGGYPLQYSAGGDYALMVRMEAFCGGDGAVKRIAEPLVTVIEDHNGVSRTLAEAQQKVVERVAEDALNQRMRLPFSLLGAVGAEPTEAEVLNNDTPSHLPSVAPPPTVGRPRAVLVTDCVGAGRGGGELSMLGLLRRVAEHGYDVHAVYLRDAGEKPLSVPWLTLHKLTRTQSMRWRGDEVTAELKAVLERLKPDVVVTESATAANIGAAMRAMHIPMVALIQFWRGLVKMSEDAIRSLDRRPIPAKALDTDGARRVAQAAALVANSRYSADIVESIVGRPVDAVVYPPVRAEDVVAKDAPPVRQRPYILCTSTQPLKGVWTFLTLAERNPDKKFLLLAGDARLVKKPKVVEKAHALPNVTVREDWVSDMREVYAQTRLLFIGTQTAESFSRTGAEARANGIPLLVSDAGNLVNMADGNAGVIVPRGSEIDAWQAGLDEALKLQPTPDGRWCRDHSGQFLDVLNRVRRLSEIAIVCPGAAGITTGAAQFRRVLGVTVLPWTASREELERYSLVTVPGHWNPELAAGLERPLAWWWCSHLAQMGTARHELSDLLKVIGDMRAHPKQPRFLLLTSQPDVEVWRQYLGDSRVRWLPNCYDLSGERHKARKLPGAHVFIPGPYAPRKNILTGVAAAAIAGADVHVTQWAKAQAPEMLDLAKALGVTAHVHDCPTPDAVRAAMGQCTATMVLSLAETYSYAAVESIEAGTPVLTWAGVPVCRKSPLAVSDPTDVGEVAAKLKDVLAAPDGIYETQRAVVERNVARFNEQARATFLALLGRDGK